MIRLVKDEDFKNAILDGLVARKPGLDIERMQDVGLRGAPDPVVLAWAAEHERIILTHDAATMPDHAYTRVDANQPMPGVFVVPQSLAVGRAINDLLLAECSLDNEWNNQVRYLPLDK